MGYSLQELVIFILQLIREHVIKIIYRLYKDLMALIPSRVIFILQRITEHAITLILTNCVQYIPNSQGFRHISFYCIFKQNKNM